LPRDPCVFRDAADRSVGAVVSGTATVMSTDASAPSVRTVTVYGPVSAGAVNRPSCETDPPVANQTTKGAGPGTCWPNWSTATAENCCVPPGATETGPPGVIARPVSVGSTTTETSDVTNWPEVSAIRTLKVYAPARPNVAVTLRAALVPLSLKVGAAAPSGSVVAVHVYVRNGSP
jgi:hypothetical protein